MKHVVGVFAVLLAMVGIGFAAVASANLSAVEVAAESENAALAARVGELEQSTYEQRQALATLRRDHDAMVGVFNERIDEVARDSENREGGYVAAIKALRGELEDLRGQVKALESRLPQRKK